MIISDEFADTEDNDGLFSGWDPEKGEYDVDDWQYKGMEAHGAAGEREGFQAHEGRAVGPRRPRRRARAGRPAEEDWTLQIRAASSRS